MLMPIQEASLAYLHRSKYKGPSAPISFANHLQLTLPVGASELAARFIRGNLFALALVYSFSSKKAVPKLVS